MALIVRLEKSTDSATAAHYRFHADGGPVRHLVLDKRSETITPTDGKHDGVFRAAATALAQAWLSTGTAPDRLIHQS